MLANFLWNSWCIGTVIGIWPRFIEPRLVKTTHLKLPLKRAYKDFDKINIVQISDLHLNPKVPQRFLNKIHRKIKKLNPDIIVFTGDFICYSDLQQKERLKDFLNRFDAPLGCFAVFGNHDYAQFVSVNSEGEYAVIKKSPPAVVKGLKRLFSSKKKTLKSHQTKPHVPIHSELEALIRETPFQLLHNETIQTGPINVTGLGEYMVDQCKPTKAFENFDPSKPGVVLAHNPDSIPSLLQYPGDLILCGHTHCGQINLPVLRDKFIMIENKQFSRGLNCAQNKWVYTNRGLGGVMDFRWFCPPEVSLLELTHDA